MNEHIAYYTRLLDKDPSDVDARLRLAAVWRSEGEKDRAVRQYAAAARLLAKNGLLLEAIAACKAIFEMEPSHTETQLFLASLYARRPDSPTVAQVIAAVQPDTGEADPWPDSDDLDRIVGIEDDVSEDGDEGGLIVLEAKDAVEELDEMELVEVDDGEPAPDADPRAESVASPLFDTDEDQITSELEPLRRRTPAPREPDLRPYEAPIVDEPPAQAPPDDLDSRPLAKADKTDTTPIKARQKPKVALTYPERVLRRALSLTAARGGNRVDLAEPPTAEAAPSDIFPPPSDPALHSKPTATYQEVESGVVQEIISHVMPSNTDATRVSKVHSAETVVASSDELEKLRPASRSGGVTRVARPHPKQGPSSHDPNVPEDVQVVSPAALSVSRADVPTTPLFSSLSPWAFVEFLKRIDLRRVPAGQVISEPTKRPRGLFIIVNGDIEVVRNQPDGSIKHLATLHRGEFFGEFELLTGRAHQATVRAVNSVDLLHLTEEVIINLAERDPTIWDVLWDFYHDRLLNNMLAGSEIFGSLDSSERERISKDFRLVEMAEEEVVVRQGEQGTGIYLILNGEVEIVHSHDGEEDSVARLRDGEFFGTVSTVTSTPRRATVRATSETTLLLLDRERLLEIAEQNPAVKEALEHLVARRQLLMGETSYARFGYKSER